MPKSSRGGKAGASNPVFTIRQPSFHPVTNPRPTPQPQPIPQPAPQPVQPVQPIQQNQPSASYDAFRKMTDDQKADVIMQARQTQVPVFLADNDLQKVLYGLKLNDKPTVVDDSVLDTLPGRELFRNVNATNDLANRIKYSAQDVAQQTIRGSVTRVSDTGGSVHGRGIYFGDSYGSSAVYGKTRGNINQTAVVRAKLNPTAKTISTHAAASGVKTEIASGSKLGKALAKINSTDRTAIWSLAKGYDVMVASNGYHVVINRSALTMSRDYKPKGDRW